MSSAPFLSRSVAALVPVLLVLSLVCAAPVSAHAQTVDAVGVRAQGMAGAFTAVADDATATWWNPAGLATGAFLSLIAEYGESRPTADGDVGHRAVAVAFPALGLSYYRMRISEIQPSDPTDPGSGGRQQDGPARVRAVDMSQYGATVGQSISGHLVLASTFKLIRAEGDTDGGLDVGAMVVAGLGRIGVMVRNLRQPTVGEGDAALTLRRQVRVGGAITTTGRSGFGGVTLAADGDLRRVPTAVGEERRLAVGGEVWSPRRVVGGRAGFSVSTIGDTRTAVSAGASVAPRPGLFLDGQVTRGDDTLRRGWTVGLRVTF
jgi:hypothetical protein